MSTDPPEQLPGTPCPFLRCAANPDNEPQTGVRPLAVGRASVRQLYEHARAHSGSRLFGAVVAGVGLMGNGFGPHNFLRNLLTLSFDSAGLTGGPLDKPRADTKILQALGSGRFSREHFDRIFERWGRPFVPEGGGPNERGLALSDLHTMVQTHRREDDGNGLTTLGAYGEFIPLWWCFARRDDSGTRYLSEADLLAMFRDMRFPENPGA
ncbi:MAG: hypothetical protein AAF799_33635 [Myxococcota bacterium]